MSQNELDGKCQKFLDDLFDGLDQFGGIGLAVELQKAEADLYGFRVAEAQRLADFIRTLAPPAPVNVRIADVMHEMIDDERRLDLAKSAPPVPSWWPGAEYKVSYGPNFPADWPPEKQSLWRWYADDPVGAAEDAKAKGYLADFEVFAAQHEAVQEENHRRKLAACMAQETSWRLAYADALLAALNPQPATLEAQP